MESDTWAIPHVETLQIPMTIQIFQPPARYIQAFTQVQNLQVPYLVYAYYRLVCDGIAFTHDER